MSAATSALPRRAGRDPRAVARELRVLLRFRLSAGGRDPRRAAALVALLTLGLALVLPVGVAVLAPRDYVDQAVVLTPWLWAAFVLASTLASLATAGGREVLPRREAVVFPISSTADQLGAIALAPLNVAWTVQAVTVLVVTAYAVGPSAWSVLALVACWAWVGAATAAAQLLGWSAELVRTYRHGVLVLRLLAGAAALVVAAALHSAQGSDLVSYGLPLVAWALRTANDPTATGSVLSGLVVLTVAAVLLSVPLGERLQRRPSPVEAGAETRRLRRSAAPGSELAGAVGTDVRSVLRSPPLRRGLVVLLATPVLLAVLLPLPWLGIVVLPALVSSGTALLHGVNAVALDGRGALWRESLPQRPDLTLVGRLVALTVLCGGSSVVVVLLAGLRAGAPDATQAVAAAMAVLLATGQVVSRCASWSVRRPYPADLRHSRDAPAPPVAMAAYAVRLSASTTGGAVLLGVGAVLGSAALCVGVAGVLLMLSALRARRAFRLHRDPALRSRAAAVVAGD